MIHKKRHGCRSELDPDPDSLEMLDPDPDSMNPDPQLCFFLFLFHYNARKNCSFCSTYIIDF
jgi:hypothetical protein